MEDLQLVNAQLALRSAKKLNEAHRKERTSMQHAINKAMEARQQLIWQIAFLAIIAIIAAIILLGTSIRTLRRSVSIGKTWRMPTRKSSALCDREERLLLTITHDIKAPAASISGFIDLMKEYVSDPKGTSCLSNIKNSASHLSQLVASASRLSSVGKRAHATEPCQFLAGTVGETKCGSGSDYRQKRRG